MPDITTLILVNSLWLAGGLVLYFFLTLRKVFLIKYMYPKLLSQPSQEKQFWNYSLPGFVYTLFSKPGIYGYTLRYLFRHKKDEWKVGDNDILRRNLNILDGMTYFLKPYLLFALIWTGLKTWIESAFWFDRWTITLGTIQQYIYQLEQFGIVHFLVKFKALVLLVLAILFLCIPFFYDKDETAKSYRRRTGYFILLLSLLGNISFLGAQLGEATAERTAKLVALKAEIIGIHDKIYQREMAVIITDAFMATVEQEEAQWQRADNYLNKQSGKISKDSLDIYESRRLPDLISDYRYELFTQYSFPSGDPPPADKKSTAIEYSPESGETVMGKSVTQTRSFIPKVYEKVSPAIAIIEDYKRQILPGESNQFAASYITNEQNWNLKGAQEIEEKPGPDPGNTATNTKKTKLYKIAEKIIDYLGGETVNGCLDGLGTWWQDLKGNKIIAKVVSLYFTESNIKKKMTGYLVTMLESVKKNASRAMKFSADRTSIVPPDETGTYKTLTESHDGKLSSLYREGVTRTIARKRDAEERGIAQPEIEKVVQDIRVKIASLKNDITFGKQNTVNLQYLDAASLREARAWMHKNHPGIYQQSLSLVENLANIQRQEMVRIRHLINEELVNEITSDGSNLPPLQQLDRLRSNYRKIQPSRVITDITTSTGAPIKVDLERVLFGAGICSRCGLPESFPFCPVGIRFR